MRRQRETWGTSDSGQIESVSFAYPLSQSPNPRFLQQRDGTPFFIGGDSPLQLVTLSPTDVQSYIDGRIGNINAVLIQAAVSPTLVATNYRGDAPFNTAIGGDWDLSSFNPAYFSRLKQIVSELGARGIAAFVYPLYLGTGGGSDGLYTSLVASGGTKAAQYGTMLGALLGASPNVSWVLGGGYIPNAAGLALNKSMSDAIKSADNYGRVWTWQAARGGQTYDLDAVTPGYRASINTPFVNSVFTGDGLVGGLTPTLSINAYQSAPACAEFLSQGYYDFSSQCVADPQLFRRQMWENLVSGGAGNFFGQDGVWNFQSGWQLLLNSTNVLQAVGINGFFTSFNWWKLQPSLGEGAGLFCFGGGGGYDTVNYKPRAISTDRKTALVYIYDGSTFTVDFSAFAANVSGYWVDPTTGIASAPIGSYTPASGTVPFTKSPATNAAGGADWVLFFN